jgi:tetratricopeptide (TPR) repeat protein
MIRPIILRMALCAAASALVCNCANPINAHTAGNYYEAGTAAERSGNWALAGRNFSRAYANAKMGNLGPKAEAYPLYEYARVTGYRGMYKESEISFREVLVLIDKAAPKANELRAPALGEYSRLLHDTGQHRMAVPVFEQAVVELDKTGVESSDPIGYASFLDDYAKSLRAAGQAGKAVSISSRSTALKSRHPNKKAKFVPRRYKA